MTDVPESVIEAIDDVYAIIEAKHEAGVTDHDDDGELDEAVARFGLALDLHCPDEWTDLDGVQRGQALALVLARRGEVRRAATVDLLVRWLERRIAEQASTN